MAVPKKTQYKTYTKNGIKYDRIEHSIKYLLIRKRLEKEVEAKLEEFFEYLRSKGHHIKRHRCRYGFCFTYWFIKRRILKEKYNIEWHSPGELNSHVRFD